MAGGDFSYQLLAFVNSHCCTRFGSVSNLAGNLRKLSAVMCDAFFEICDCFVDVHFVSPLLVSLLYTYIVPTGKDYFAHWQDLIKKPATRAGGAGSDSLVDALLFLG